MFNQNPSETLRNWLRNFSSRSESIWINSNYFESIKSRDEHREQKSCDDYEIILKWFKLVFEISEFWRFEKRHIRNWIKLLRELSWIGSIIFSTNIPSGSKCVVSFIKQFHIEIWIIHLDYLVPIESRFDPFLMLFKRNRNSKLDFLNFNLVEIKIFEKLEIFSQRMFGLIHLKPFWIKIDDPG